MQRLIFKWLQVVPCVVALLFFSSIVSPPLALAQGPSLASSYQSTIHNTTIDATTTLALTSIVQKQQAISGKVVIGPGLLGSGPFTGTIGNDGSVNFTDTPTDGSSTIFFKGLLRPDGSLGGTYNSPSVNQQGTWGTGQTTPGNPCTTATPQAGVFYHVEAVQTPSSPVDGMGGYLTQSKVSVSAQPLNWSITQILAESANGQDALGVGWVVEPAPPPDGYGDTNFHLFVFTRHQGKNCLINKDSTGWSGSFHPLVTAPLPQGILTQTNTTHEFLVRHIRHTWLIGYEAGWIGSIDDVQWDNQFTQVAKAHWYGEVHSPNAYPQVEMGDGICGRFNGAAQIEKMFLISSKGKSIGAQASLLKPQNSPYYDSDKTSQSSSFNSFRYGGAGTLHQAAGSCPP